MEFAQGVTEQKLHVIILDDLGKPLMEGAEHFEIFLSLPVKGSLGAPEVATITINDTYSDCKFCLININFYQNSAFVAFRHSKKFVGW